MQKGDCIEEKVIVRLFYIPKCSGGGCCCSPDPNLAAFADAAEKLTKKFGEDHVSFEAYTSIDVDRFPFLRNAKQVPLIVINERIVSSGKKPEQEEIELELNMLNSG